MHYISHGITMVQSPIMESLKTPGSHSTLSENRN